MRPFQEFKLWARRAPVGERAVTGVAALIVLALVAWLMVPDRDGLSDEVALVDQTPTTMSGSPTTDGSGATGDAGDAGGDGEQVASGTTGGGTGSGGSANAGGSADASQGGGSQGQESSGGGSGAEGAESQGCQSPPGSTKGVTEDEVRIAVVLTEIVGPAANELFSVPPPAQARADFEAAIAGVNREGGVACRDLVAEYVTANPVNESQMMELCRELADREILAAVDTGSLATRPAVLACFGQRQIPYFGAFYITETAQQQFFPYLYSFYTKEHLYWSTAFGLRDLGFFDPDQGFEKLGFVYRDCEGNAIDAFRGWLREAGVSDDEIVTYNVGCPAVFANEVDLAQAVLTFKREGATHVIPANMQGDIARFTANAEQQNYRPQYGVPDEAILSIAEGSRSPDPDNFANAIAITLSREAEHNTPGMSPTAGTQKCNQYREAAGLEPVYEVPANAGHACDQLWMLRAALDNAPELSPEALPAGLTQAGSVEFSFPQGPNDFTGQGVTTGGQFWRPAEFTPDCDCWRVTRSEFQRGYG